MSRYPISFLRVSAFSISALLLLNSCTADNKSSASTSDGVIQLRVLETSDLHANMMDYNYYANTVDPSLGLARTATLIANARQEVANTVLVDNGDLIQGSPMGDYVAHKGLDEDEVHPVYQAMNTLNYTVGNIGNHEFNYGLEFLEKTLAGAQFPYINANVLCAQKNCWKGIKEGEHLFTPYLIKDTELVDNKGAVHNLKIGYIGFVPPQILQWDKQRLTDKVKVLGIIEAAKLFVPQMKAQGADVVIAIAHSGIGSTENPGDPYAENAVYAITQVNGIDAVMFGHSHAVFPSERYKDLAGANIEKGLLNGIPAVMPGRWGDNLGQVDLTLKQMAGKWQVIDANAKAIAIMPSANEAVAADTALQTVISDAHLKTIDFMQRPIGVASSDMYSFLAQIQDDPSVQIVADAQIAKVKAMLPSHYAHLPVLSAAAPFKAGGRRGTPADTLQYIQVKAGALSFRNAADLYLYPNMVTALKLTGKEVKDWLECSAGQFNQINPTLTDTQTLVNYQFATYNADVMDGVSYQIDVTQPNRFDDSCKLVNDNAERIVDLRFVDQAGNVYEGRVFYEKEFIVATNNYRAFGRYFAGTGAQNVVLELSDTNRDALVQYIEEQSRFDKETGLYQSMVHSKADNNWRIKAIQSDVALDIRFSTQNSAIADEFVKQNQQWPMTKLDVDELGFAQYRVNLQSYK